MNSTQSKTDHFWAIIILLLIVALIVYAVSFGKVDLITEKPGDKDSLSEKRRLAEIRHKKLQSLIKAKKNLKIKLDKRFKTIYLLVRIAFLCIYVGLNIALYFVLGMSDISVLFNWNQMVLTAFGVLNLILIGTEIKLTAAIGYFKTLIENRVYAKYVNINQQINNHQSEAELLSPVLALNQSTLVEASTQQP